MEKLQIIKKNGFKMIACSCGRRSFITTKDGGYCNGCYRNFWEDKDINKLRKLCLT